MSNATESSVPAPKRPLLARAASTTATAPTITTTTSPSYGTIPTSSKKPNPALTRALTTTGPDVPTPPPSTSRPPLPPTRPSLWRRATTALELTPQTSLTHLHAPTQPTHWLDHPHRASLIKTWDTVQQEDSTAAAAKSKFPRSITAQVLTVKQRMGEMYPLLLGGEQVLTGEWIEYVLGVALRAPFSSGRSMGRWEILASNSAGARGVWGPW